MKKKLLFTLSVCLLATLTSCKSKQMVTEVPAGAYMEATDPNKTAESNSKPIIESTPVATTNTTQTSKPVQETSPVTPSTNPEPEKVRNENFSLANGETNTDALKSKYHVVVGSFGVIDNAKSLQKKLKDQGNASLVVVNETNMYRVIINSFNDYTQARNYIKTIEQNYQGAWVLVKK